MSNIKLGITLYCFTAEYAKGIYSFEDIVRIASEIGAEGYEIVATQMIPSYPYVSDEFLGQVNDLKVKYGIGPISYAANNDRGKLPDRDQTEAEMLAGAIKDIKSAHKLGCKYMRAQFLLSPNSLEKLATYAKEYDVKVGIEIHNPETPSTPIMQEYLKVIKNSGSEYIGFIPDFGCFATKPNKPQWDAALEQGAHEEMLKFAAQLRYNETPREEAKQKFIDAGANEAEMMAFEGMYGFVTFYNKPDLEGLKNILPYVFYCHGKFHYLDKQNKEASIPYDEILSVLRHNNFNGFIVSEYEDHTSGRALEMTKRHLQMEYDLLNKQL